MGLFLAALRNPALLLVIVQTPWCRDNKGISKLKAGKQVGKKASRQTGKQASNQVSKQAGKQAVKQAST